MKHYAGLDVSLKETSICIVDETGKFCRELKVTTHPEDLLRVLRDPVWNLVRVGLEAGPLSQWLFRALTEASLPVVCIETRHTRAYTLKLWDLATVKEIRTFTGAGWVNSVAFSPDGRTALSGSDDSTLKLWDLTTGNKIRTFAGHRDRVCSLAFSPDGRTALSGSDDMTLKLWDLLIPVCRKNDSCCAAAIP